MTFNIQKTKLQRKHYLQGLKTIKNKIIKKIIIEKDVKLSKQRNLSNCTNYTEAKTQKKGKN